MAVLETRGLHKRFGKIVAVDGIDLRIADGEMLAVLGPSGCGKTTLMRMIAGLEQPTSGDIFLNDVRITGVPPRRRNVAMVFQSYALYPHMSVLDNILFPLRCRDVPEESQKEKLERVSRILGIENLLERSPIRLSGGQKQRVALARALVRDPELFIFDEPLSALDAQVRSIARAELRDLHERTGITTLYVTHDQLEAMGLADRIAVLKDGRIRQLGTPQELYDDPADLFVAGFIGNPPMNLFDRGSRIWGVRPEHLLPARPQAEDAEIIKIQVDQIEFLGVERLVYGFEVDRPESRRVVVRLPPADGSMLRQGEKRDFYVPRRRIRQFDAATGRKVEGSASA